VREGSVGQAIQRHRPKYRTSQPLRMSAPLPQGGESDRIALSISQSRAESRSVHKSSKLSAVTLTAGGH
jgi:hypothetical protein